MDHDQDLPTARPEERDPGSRPVAIGGTPLASFDEPGLPGHEAPAGLIDQTGELPEGPPPFIHDERPVIEDARGELFVGLAAVLQAVAAFLPWYKTFGLYEISGWASGTWGPVVFFLGVAGAAIIALRRVGVPLAFPISYSLLLEGIGWVSVLGLLLKRFFPPEGFSVVGVSANPLDMGYWVALLAAVGVAMLASRLSRNTPIVVLPGWFRSKAGKLGAGLVALAIAGGAAFGLMNDAGKALAAARGDRTGGPGLVGEQPTVEKGMPKCLKDLGFVEPQGVTADQGFGSETNDVCTASLSSTASLAKVTQAFRAAMTEAGWTFTVVDSPASANASLFQVTKPKCGNVSIFDNQAQKKRVAQILLGGEELCQQIQQQQSQTPN